MKTYEVQEFGIDKLALVEREIPRPDDGQVLVRLRAAALNYRDVMVASGTYNPRMRRPSVPFSDAAGEIVETGPGVTKWSVGDRVCSTVIPEWTGGEPSAGKAKSAIGAGNDGVLCEYRVFNEEAIVAAPAHLSFVEASTLPCAALTAWNALAVSGQVKPGESVLTLGTGGVSVFAVQFAKLLGARVISTSSSDEKLERIRHLGSDETINYRAREDWDKAVLELSDGIGVDHVIEVGGVGTLTRSVKSVRFGGHVALIGALGTEGDFNPIPIFMKAIRVQGIFIGSGSMFEDMNEAISGAGIRPVVDRIFPFAEAREALHEMATGSHFGKIVIEF